MTVTVCPVLSRPCCILPTKEPPIVSQRNYDRLFDWVIMKYNSCYLSCRKLFSNDTTISRSSTNRTNNVNFLDARPTHVGSQYTIINSVCKNSSLQFFCKCFDLCPGEYLPHLIRLSGLVQFLVLSVVISGY